MHGPNNNPREWAQHMVDEQVEAFRVGVKKVIGRILDEPEEPSLMHRVLVKAGRLIQAHPVAAAGVVLGLGLWARHLGRRHAIPSPR